VLYDDSEKACKIRPIYAASPCVSPRARWELLPVDFGWLNQSYASFDLAGTLWESASVKRTPRPLPVDLEGESQQNILSIPDGGSQAWATVVGA
jgi:hypothetical protein